MCGISGMVSLQKNNFIARSSVFKSIAELQVHRGPDNFGIINLDNYIFCHNRLSIIDVSTNSNQPLMDDEFVLVYNGEIYNYLELAKKYSIEETNSDTTVLFQLLKQHGTKVIEELNGMFAFAHFNKVENKLILSRDRLGIKPLYYSIIEGEFVFASEIKTILAYYEKIEIKPSINKLNFNELILMNHIENNTTIYDSISNVGPGEVIEVKSNGEIVKTIYYSLLNEIKLTTNQKKEAKLIDELDELLYNSVKMHLISDVKTGTLCSGGIDSSLITAIASKLNPQISIYHAGVEGNGGEEEYAEIVAKHLNVSIMYTKMNFSKYISFLPIATYYSDLPLYHPNDISLYEITKAAKKDGTSVLLAGEGADELFGGYSWHLNFKNRISRVDNNFTKSLNKIYRFISHKVPSILNTNVSNDQYFSMSSTYMNFDVENIFKAAYKNSLIINKESWSTIYSLYSKYQDTNMNKDDAMIASYISNNLFGHLSTLLHRNDRMSMANSVETRVPFLENKIIHFALNLDVNLKIRNNQTKYLLKKVAERYIPKANIYRAKAGFPVPWTTYLSQVNKNIFKGGFLVNFLNITNEQFEQFMDNCSADLLFSMLSIEIWGRIHIYKEKYWELEHKIQK